MQEVKVSHREARDWSDRVAFFAVKVLRWGLDTVSGYKHTKAVRNEIPIFIPFVLKAICKEAT